MISDLQQIFSTNARGIKRSAIRELLKLTKRPEIISFAGGLPAADTFPVQQLREIIDEMMETEPHSVLQYGPTEGDVLLRTLLAERYQKDGMDVTADNILVTTASQQGLDLLAKIFCDRGDTLIVGKPTYLGGLQAFVSYGANLVGVPLDEHGMRVDILEEKLTAMKAEGKKPKFIYVIPDFQNPAGITMPDHRRQKIVELAHKFDVLVVEDSPYRELRFEGKPAKPVFAHDNTGSVITLGTFSKIFCPGFRLGWTVAHPDIIDKMVIAKQAVDLCTPPFNQRIAARYMEKGYLDQNIKGIVESYREKRDIMLDAFDKYMPKGVEWTRPEGGLFLFLTLPEHMDSGELFKKAIKENVAFVLGSAFFCDGSGKNTMRINFSFASKKDNVEGVKRLARVIEMEM